MRSAAVWQFTIPMDAGIVLRNQRVKQRCGLVVRLTLDEREGWGEVAPLPGFSHESLDEAKSCTREWLNSWLKGEADSLPDIPSVAFGLSCALAELNGELPEQADYRLAPLCSGDPDALLLSLAAMPDHPVAKVKIGEYEAVRDGMVVNLLLEAIDTLSLRLDTNRGWSAEKARQFARYVNPANRPRIAFIEEPCKTRALSRAFAEETGISIAWDESLRETDFVWAAEPGVVAVVIKPTLTGSLDKVRQQICEAHRLGWVAVISSSLESSLGLTQLARLAAWLTPGVIPGLDTLSLMQAQVIRPWPQSPLPCWSTAQLERIQ